MTPTTTHGHRCMESISLGAMHLRAHLKVLAWDLQVLDRSGGNDGTRDQERGEQVPGKLCERTFLN